MRLGSSHQRIAISGNNELSSNFRKAMFWDVEMDKLSIQKDKIFIIERILAGSMRNPKYLDRLEKLYPVQDIKKVAEFSKSIRGNDSIRFIADRYGINPKSFKQYI